MLTSSLKILWNFFANHPLTRTSKAQAWLRFGLWQLRSRTQNVVVFDWIEGQRLAVQRGMNGATGNIYTGLQEFADMLLLLHFLRENDLFLDIGANVGSYTVLAAGVRNALVWSFEPDPQAVRALKRNLELNGLDKAVVVFEIALSDCDGYVTFTRGLDTVNRVATLEDRETQQVHRRRLDALIGLNKPAMIKIDVEGHQEAVFRGAERLLALESLKVIEVDSVTPEMRLLFATHGFERAYYDPFKRNLAKTPIREMGEANELYVRDWDFVTSRLISAPPIKVLGRVI